MSDNFWIFLVLFIYFFYIYSSLTIYDSCSFIFSFSYSILYSKTCIFALRRTLFFVVLNIFHAAEFRLFLPKLIFPSPKLLRLVWLKTSVGKFYRILSLFGFISDGIVISAVAESDLFIECILLSFYMIKLY